MQSSQAYVEQIAPGVRPPTSGSPAPRVVAPTAARSPPPAGLYLQVASALTQEQAARASLDVVARAGAGPPAFIRGVAVKVGGEVRIRMFAGPFADEAEARAFCARVIAGEPCLLRTFLPSPPTGSAR